MATPSVESDTRGIMAPARMPEFARLSRFDAPPELVGLVDWFWCVEWDLPEGVVHPQRVLTQPAVNVSVGNPPPDGPNPPPGPWRLRTEVSGVATGMTIRSLAGRGFTLAAKTTTGGFGAWVDDVSAFTDSHRPGAEVLGIGNEVAAQVAAVAKTGMGDGVDVLASALMRVIQTRPVDRTVTARDVAAIASVAESDRTIRRVDELAAVAGCTRRTLQRLFASYVGVSPTWVIRRFRILDAAELVRHGDEVEWASVAADLGYADQAHLVRDFTANIGTSPAAYAREQRAERVAVGAATTAAATERE